MEGESINVKRSLYVLLISLLISGCVEPKIIDDINIISAVGYDSHEGNKVKGTVIIPVYKADKSISNESFTAVAKQSKAINRKLQQKSADPLENGSIEVVLFGKEQAEKGVIDMIDTLERDAKIGSHLILAVVDGEAQTVLDKNLGNRGTGTYLNTLLMHNMKRRELPRTNLHLYLFSYYSRLKDPFLPYIELEEDDKVNVKGVALFKDEKVISYLDESEMFFFKALMENFENGSYTFETDDEYVTLFSLTLDRDYKVKDALTNPVVELKVKLDAHIREFSGEKLDPKTLKKIEKRFEEIIVKKCEEMLNDFKEKHIDPVGIGLFAQTQTRNFDKKKWNEVYAKATIKVDAEVSISETGIVE
jgi:spore germination protein